MDLTTTKIIKRRVLNIQPDPYKELTNCYIKVINWTNKQDLRCRKMRVSSFFLNNASIPCFIPKWIEKAYTNSDLTNKLSGTLPAVNFPNSAIVPTTLNYIVGIRNPTTGKIYARMVEMTDAVSKYPSLKPPNHPNKSFEQYNNRYYHFFNTSDFCQIVQDTLNQVFADASISLPQDAVRIIRTTNGYSLYQNSQTSYQAFDILFSNTLNDLFQFKSTQSVNSTLMQKIIFNTSPITYETYQWNPVFSNYVPNTWFPYDLLVIKSDIPAETETYYDNNGYLPSNYENIILTFKLVVEAPDAIYNLFTSEINPNSGWLTLQNNNSGENVYFEIFLRLRETNDLVNYTIKQNEKAYFFIEDVLTE